MIKRSREADAFLATIGQTALEAVSACDGWTTHEIAAHVTGIAVEVIRHLEPYLQGDPVPRTRFNKPRVPVEVPFEDRGPRSTTRQRNRLHGQKAVMALTMS